MVVHKFWRRKFYRFIVEKVRNTFSIAGCRWCRSLYVCEVKITMGLGDIRTRYLVSSLSLSSCLTDVSRCESSTPLSEVSWIPSRPLIPWSKIVFKSLPTIFTLQGIFKYILISGVLTKVVNYVSRLTWVGWELSSVLKSGTSLT